MKASPYERALDDLHFSEEAQMRIVQNLEAQTAGATIDPTLPMPATMTRKAAGAGTAATARRRPVSRRAALTLALAATLAVGGGAAYATGALTSVVDAFSGLFGNGPAQTELIDKLGVPLGAQAQANGVTVTADAAIGDAHGYAAVFSIARDDGEPFDLTDVQDIDGVLAGLAFADELLDVDGLAGETGSSWFFDADPTDNAIQYMVRRDMATTSDGGSVAGRSATAHFGDLVVRDAEDPSKETVVAQGPWDLALTFDYEDQTVEVALNPDDSVAAWDGREATVQTVSVSPLGVYVAYTMDGVPLEQKESGQVSPEVAASWDSYTGLPITVTFADGTQQRFEDGNGPSSMDVSAGDKTEVFRGCPFEKIANVDDIASVTVGDLEIAVQ